MQHCPFWDFVLTFTTCASPQSVLEKSQLPYDALGKIWNMADVDEDGYLDSDEFCVAMHLCHEMMEGRTVGDTLDPKLIPLSKRGEDRVALCVLYPFAACFASSERYSLSLKPSCVHA